MREKLNNLTDEGKIQFLLRVCEFVVVFIFRTEYWDREREIHIERSRYVRNVKR